MNTGPLARYYSSLTTAERFGGPPVVVQKRLAIRRGQVDTRHEAPSGASGRAPPLTLSQG
jgi:hypothetical protein